MHEFWEISSQNASSHLDLRHTWIVQYNARSNQIHPRNITKYCACHKLVSSRLDRKIRQVLPPIQRRFEHDLRMKPTRRNPSVPKASSIEKIQSILNFSIQYRICSKSTIFFNISKVSKFNRKINRKLFQNQSKIQSKFSILFFG